VPVGDTVDEKEDVPVNVVDVDDETEDDPVGVEIEVEVEDGILIVVEVAVEVGEDVVDVDVDGEVDGETVVVIIGNENASLLVKYPELVLKPPSTYIVLLTTLEVKPKNWFLKIRKFPIY